MLLPRRTASICATIATAFALTACGATTQTPSSSPTTTASAPSASAATDASFNEADVMFASQMIPHHTQAVMMSDLLLAKSPLDPEVETLAQQIKAAQAPEIKTMTSWLTAWGKPLDGGMAGMDHGDDGMMSATEMQQLTQADAANAQRLYVAGMIKHHEGAVVMAETEMKAGQDPDAIQLARDIVAAQQSEIATMKALLPRL